MNLTHLDALRRLLKPDQVLTEPEDLSIYAVDGTAILNQRPACMVLPENAEQVAGTLAVAHDAGIRWLCGGQERASKVVKSRWPKGLFSVWFA